MNKYFITNSLSDPTTAIPTGLFTGKMGICLYLFHTGETEKAHEWLQAVYKELPEMKGDISMERGLCGAGMAIGHLIREGYLNGDVNVALQEIDNSVFRQLAYERHSKEYNLTALIHLLYYLTARWKEQEKGSDAEYIFKSLITQTMNGMYARIDAQSISEPLHYSLDYALPQTLFIMDYLFSQALCRQRIERMMGELAPVILSTIPRIQANRLYLLCGMNALASHGACPQEWKKHASILLDSIDVDHILTKEMGCKSIYINNGASSLYFLLRQINGYADKIDEYKKRIMTLIDNSPEWQLLAENKAYLRSHLGLYSGICGVASAYEFMERQKENNIPS